MILVAPRARITGTSGASEYGEAGVRAATVTRARLSRDLSPMLGERPG